MLKTFSDKTASWLVKSRVISNEDFALYSFAVYNLLFTIIPTFAFIIVCSFIGNGGYAFILVCAILAMRRYTGGYHASRPTKCFMISVLLLSACMGLIQIIDNSILISSIVIFSAMVIWIFSPIDSVNYRLSECKKIKYRKRARITLVAEVGLYVLLSSIQFDKAALCFACGMIAAAVLLVVCISSHS